MYVKASVLLDLIEKLKKKQDKIAEHLENTAPKFENISILSIAEGKIDGLDIAIEELNKVQAEAIEPNDTIHCKDCVWCNPKDRVQRDGSITTVYVCDQHEMHVMKSDYCSFGRKRE